MHDTQPNHNPHPSTHHHRHRLYVLELALYRLCGYQRILCRTKLASMLERDAGLKYFGDLIPEYGGIMDRVQSCSWYCNFFKSHSHSHSELTFVRMLRRGRQRNGASRSVISTHCGWYNLFCDISNSRMNSITSQYHFQKSTINRTCIWIDESLFWLHTNRWSE